MSADSERQTVSDARINQLTLPYLRYKRLQLDYSGDPGSKISDGGKKQGQGRENKAWENKLFNPEKFEQTSFFSKGDKGAI